MTDKQGLGDLRNSLRLFSEKFRKLFYNRYRNASEYSELSGVSRPTIQKLLDGDYHNLTLESMYKLINPFSEEEKFELLSILFLSNRKVLIPVNREFDKLELVQIEYLRKMFSLSENEVSALRLLNVLKKEYTEQELYKLVCSIRGFPNLKTGS